jgi:arginyl-tRNA synthetase
MNLLAELRRRFAEALAPVVEPTPELLDMVRRAQDPKFGDYQANMAMPLKARLAKSPRDIAADIVGRLKIDDLCEPPEIAGPGFINLRLKDSLLVAQLQAAVGDDRLGVQEAGQARKTIVIDYSAPNVAKPMHVGHIRSTVIGDALARTLRFLGHRVIGDNHLGDWGTQFGMIIYGYKHFRNDEAIRTNAVDELARLYRLVNQLVEYEESKAELPAKREELATLQAAIERQSGAPTPADKKAAKEAERERRRMAEKLSEGHEAIASLERKITAVESSPDLHKLAQQHADIGAKVLSETAKLHANDPENLALWKRFMPACLERLNQAYDRLGVKFDVAHGESFYHDRLAGVVDSLLRRGIARESEGAICVFPEQEESVSPPMIVRKKDGAFLYSTSDLATIQYRMETWHPDVMLYVVDHRQSLHFEQLFAVARRWGFDQVEYRHLGFGTIMGKDGKPYRTRAGDTVGLEGLLDEAVARAYRVVCELDDDPIKNPDGPQLSEEERRRVAEVVGLGGLKYADLSHNRTSDYIFDYDKMLVLNGNTATYMQYAYARVQSIFRKGQVRIEALRGSGAPVILGHAAERALALEILRFAEALDDVVADYRPNLLTGYLFDQLARQFSTFFEQCPVLKAETPALRTSRLLLCDLTARTIRKGLDLLGIGVVEKM